MLSSFKEVVIETQKWEFSMEKLIFNEKNIFILSKMVSLLRKETGNRHKLSTEQCITALLKDATQSRNPMVIDFYHRFLENLTAEQIREIQERGIDVPNSYVKKVGLFPTPIRLHYAHVSNHS